MSSSDSSSESHENSEFSDYDLEIEDDANTTMAGEDAEEGESINLDGFAYSEEPIADEEWVMEYERQQREAEKLEEELTKRLNCSTPTSEWCKCGHCEITNLQNLSECYCCSELDGCQESLTSDLVVQDLSDSMIPECITLHPGFNPVCLQKWSLRLAADKYKKKNKETYKQTGSEERFLRSVAYREFSRMVYGLLGKKRYPLPACAYTAIRKTFPTQDFSGYEMEENL